MLSETLSRLTSAVPAYWRKVQVLCLGLFSIALAGQHFKEYVLEEIQPWCKRVATVCVIVAATAQLTDKDKRGSALVARAQALTGGAPPDPVGAPSPIEP